MYQTSKYQIQVLINGELVFQENLPDDFLTSIQKYLRQYEVVGV